MKVSIPNIRTFRRVLCFVKYYRKLSSVARCVVVENHANENAIRNSGGESVHWFAMAAIRTAKPVASCWSLNNNMKRSNASTRFSRLSFARRSVGGGRDLAGKRRNGKFFLMRWNSLMRASSVLLRYFSGIESERYAHITAPTVSRAESTNDTRT
jgi:hypothetical protein